ncbi:MAG: radical SAM protein [Deltaproteobacteria bacterium]|nr:radical SAM protein [Deltaproteobacteria bacterium]
MNTDGKGPDRGGSTRYLARVTPEFEQGPIRPPSEAQSLLVRVVRNCPWNKCAFCPVYKRRKPSSRPTEDVLADIDGMAAAADEIRRSAGGVGRGDDALAGFRRARRDGAVPGEAAQVALFRAAGGRSAFLQDADPCAVPAAKLAEIVRRVRERFPGLERVTTYARASTLAKRSAEDLRMVAEAGLSRVHVGLETGSDEVLARVKKGTTAAQQIDAGRKALGAGFELCFYVMPGLGGRDGSGEHVRGTAEVIRAVAGAAPAERPLVVRLRTTAVAPGVPLWEEHEAGRFELPDDVETAREIRALLEAVRDSRLLLVSDHSLNLLPELEGELPGDAERLVGVVDEFLALPEDERAAFALGRRIGAYWTLADRGDPGRRAVVERAAESLGARTTQEILAAAAELRSRYV